MNIRKVIDGDFDGIWPIFHNIIFMGETYAYPRDTSKVQAQKIWIEAPRKTYVVEEEGIIVGTYFIKTNQAGAGEHVCNCGYMVAPFSQGRGLGMLMCQHSQQQALELGYKAMQFNFVAASNTGALKLWHKLGFATVGCLPKAFLHPQLGYIDAMVMYKWLTSS